jgi:hypothetical protein
MIDCAANRLSESRMGVHVLGVVVDCSISMLKGRVLLQVDDDHQVTLAGSDISFSCGPLSACGRLRSLCSAA